MTDEPHPTSTPTPAESWDMAGAITPGYDETAALVVVDMQNDFGHPDGSLHVPGSESILGSINGEIERAATSGATVVLTQDWHPEHTPHFRDDGGTWPVHCVAGTWGALLLDGLDPDHHADVVMRKGTNGEDGYSAFTVREPQGGRGGHQAPTGLAGLLQERGVERVVVVGLAADVCVADTAVDAAEHGFDTTVLWASTRPVDADEDTIRRVIDRFHDAGVAVIDAP